LGGCGPLIASVVPKLEEPPTQSLSPVASNLFSTSYENFLAPAATF
jgi:hypothetical protein